MNTKQLRIKGIRDELSYIGRYQQSISPKLSKYAELEVKKKKLRDELKKLES